jgi:hypothetical protein
LKRVREIDRGNESVCVRERGKGSERGKSKRERQETGREE